VAPSDDVARPSDRRGLNGSTRITPKVAFGDAVAAPADDLGFADISMDLPLPMSAMNSNKRNSATSTTSHTRGPTAANNPLSVNQGGNAHAPDSDPDSSDAGDDDDDEPEAPPTNFEMNSFTLMFTDAAAERGYVRFITGQAYFAAGKLYAAIGSFILLALILPYLRWHPTWAGLTNGFILFLLGSVTAGFVCFGLMFLSTAPRWREVLFTIVLATHWLSFGTATVRAKQDGVNRYAITTLCLFYCFFLAQPRFILMVVFLMIMSTAAVATVTFGSAGYFDSHSHFEILYWPLLIALFPIHILRQFERRSRAAFEASETTRAFLGGLARRTKAMHRIIARSYPVAAATRLLQSHGAEQYALYPSTALIVTDVQGFTAWAAVTSNDAVVEGISKMFIAMENAAMKFAVEKIATVGDSFVGAVFPPPQSAATANGTGAAGELDTAMRCHRMFRFANAVVRNPKSMAVRVGVHVGDVMGGFVGLQPPKFDVFGSGIQVAQELETTGRPKHIHASNAAVEAASELGFRSQDSEVTPQGTVFAAWRLQDPRTHAAAAAQMAADTRSVEEDAMQLCALVARSSEALYQRTMRQGDTRDEVTRKRLRTLAAAAAQTRARIPRDDGDQQLLHLTTDDLAASTPMDDFAGSSINKFAASVLVRAGSADADADADDETSSTVLTTPATVVAEDDVSNMFGFSYVTLKFDDAEAEADYARWYLATGLPTAIFTTLTYMMVYLLAAHVCVACTHSVRNKLAVVVAVAISLGYLHFLREKGTAHGHNPKLAIGVYVSVTFAMGLLYEPGCADVVNERAPENSIMTMGLLCPVAAMLCLELRFFVRIAIHALMCGSL
jgi:class 3 adenylate cyclase